jgi:tetratricopeptide (TPR) repeat protein
MTRTKKIIKKKLKKPDEFITLTERAFLFITHHCKSIAIGGGVVLAVILLIFLFQKWEKKNEDSAYQMFHLAVETYRGVSSPYQEGSPQEYKTVLEKFDEVITKFPRTSSGKIAILYKGNISLRLGEFEDAIKAYEGFLRKIGKEKLYRSFAMDGLGYSHEGKKEYEKAANAFQKVIDLGESYQLADAYLGLGRCYEKLGKTKEAVENYKNFLKVSQKSEMTNIVLRKISNLEK